MTSDCLVNSWLLKLPIGSCKCWKSSTALKVLLQWNSNFLHAMNSKRCNWSKLHIASSFSRFLKWKNKWIFGSALVQWKVSNFTWQQFCSYSQYKIQIETKTISVKYTINFQYFKPMLLSPFQVSLTKNYSGYQGLFFYVWRREITWQSHCLFKEALSLASSMSTTW